MFLEICLVGGIGWVGKHYGWQGRAVGSEERHGMSGKDDAKYTLLLSSRSWRRHRTHIDAGEGGGRGSLNQDEVATSPAH